MADRHAIYAQLTQAPGSLLESDVTPHVPHPSSGDIERGFMDRYFAQRTTDARDLVIEISRSMHGTLQRNSMYRTCHVEWRIKGPLHDVSTSRTVGVITANQLTIQEATKEVPGLPLKLRDLQQYWIGS